MIFFAEMTDSDPELLHQLRGPKDVIMDLDFHPKSKQVKIIYVLNFIEHY